jgi:hypothetical protein
VGELQGNGGKISKDELNICAITEHNQENEINAGNTELACSIGTHVRYEKCGQGF